MRSSQIHFLKSDPDFAMFMKVGRMINAITFVLTAYVSFAQHPGHTANRQMARGIFIMAGCVHESIGIIREVGERHISMESFIPLRKLAYNVEFEKHREYARMVRNYCAFHISESVQHRNTQRAIEKLEHSSRPQMGGD